MAPLKSIGDCPAVTPDQVRGDGGRGSASPPSGGAASGIAAFAGPPPSCRHPRARPEEPPTRHVLSSPSIPATQSRAYNPPIPPRIHRKALRRGGVGAGREGRTRNLTHRVRGKWSPSGDPGEAAGRRAGPSFLLIKSPGVPVWHTRGSGLASGGACGESPGSPGAMEDGADRQPWLRHRKSEGVHGSFSGKARHRSHRPVPAERLESRAKTAERGAGWCQYINITDAAAPAPRPHADPSSRRSGARAALGVLHD